MMNSTGKKTIICYDVPAALLHKAEAKRYFKSFGTIKKIVVKTKSRKCVVEYDSAEAAEEALTLGGEYEGEEFPIEFQLKPTTSKQKAKKDPDPDWDLNDEVKAELEAMGMAAGNFSGGAKKQYNLRPEKMSVDAELSALVKKLPKKRTTDAGATAKKQNSMNAAAEKDLLTILKQRAESTEDKYRMLDARDKLIRLRSKNVDVHKLGVTVGTCPDMCPEKERLMREVQHQVALYEAAADRSMNHAVAVKQYSRSSADQEAPLPHELRGVEVLQMTMGYLMHRIMRLADAPDVNLGEWYHFLWDRMRGIRKDITQQELTCRGSVRLVEQCARFHVHCSARLVAEDAAVFDQKINTENLTKCLQTLKYMYADLALQGERCPEEAEFRAYVILLNLNDGNFMWEVQQLPADIQKSGEVKFALEVYSSLDKNNFVKFFKLVRATTYLNACILLRYFVQVRTKALRTIAKCYTPRMPHAQFPVPQLTEMLAFEDRASCVDFVEFCGLTVTADRHSVVLNTRGFQDPDVPYALERAVRVIESKRVKSLGEVVCGEELPPPLFETHQPQDSFTPSGHLKNAEEFGSSGRDETDRGVFKVKERSNSPWNNVLENPMNGAGAITTGNCKPSGFTFGLPQSLPRGDLLLDEEKEKERRRELERQRATERLRLQQQQIQAEQFRLQEEKRRRQLVLEQERLEKQRVENQRLLEEARVKAEERRLAAQRDYQLKLEEKRRREEAHQLELLEKRQREERKLEELKQQELERERQRLEDARRQRIALQEAEAEAEAQRLREIDRAVQTVVTKLVTDVEESYRVARLGELRDNILARFAVQKWRAKVSSNDRKRKAIDQGPLWDSRLSAEEVDSELCLPQQQLTLNMMKRYKRGVAVATSEGRTPPRTGTLDARVLKDLTANGLLRNAARTRRLQNDLFWKIGVHFEDDDVRQVLDEIVGWDRDQVMLKRVRVNQNTLTYCFEKTKIFGKRGKGKDEALEDMNALIVVVRKLREELVDSLLEYLNGLGDLVCLPVFFVVEQEDGQLREEVDTLVRNKLISEREDLVCDFTKANLAVAFGRGLSYLSECYRPPPPLLLNTLRAFLLENLAGEFFQRVRAFAKWHMPYKRCVAKPQVAVGLFNEAVDKLEEVMFQEERYEFPAFPNIFKGHLPNEIPDFLPCDYKHFPSFWTDREYNDQLREAVRLFKLPEYDGEWPLEAGPSLERRVYEYCQLACDNSPKTRHKLFLKIVANLLHSGEAGHQSWMDVVEIILAHKLASIDLALPGELKAKTIFNQFVVVYHAEKLKSFVAESWFYLKNPLVDKLIDAAEEVEDVGDEPPASCQLDPGDDLELCLKRAFESDEQEDERAANAKKCRAAMDDFRHLLDDLEKSMKIQRVVSERFQANLKSCLDKT